MNQILRFRKKLVSHKQSISTFYILLAWVIFQSTHPLLVCSEENQKQLPGEAKWGIGATVRTAAIAFDSHDESVSSVVPMLFFDGEHFFLDGVEGGMKLWKTEQFRLDLLGRLRFFDIPREFQNAIQADTVDAGIRLKYFIDGLGLSLDLLSDKGGRMHSNFKVEYSSQLGAVDIHPYLNFQMTGSEFNSYYYGLNQVDVSGGNDISIGMKGEYHLWKNLYAIFRLQAKWLGESVRESPYVDRDIVEELYLGFAFLNDKSRPLKEKLAIGPYFRVAHGWATPSNMGDILSGNTESDPHNNQLTSLFYGYPLADELFDFPLQIYLTPGFVHHWSSEVQSTIQEYVLAIKAYYTFNWPLKWRFGAAEGVSYVSEIPYVENSEMERKGYEPSNLMNYLDFSIDIELGDLFKSPSLKNWYFGYSIHHRSSIFESASQFGRISGGANFNTVYLQYHF